MSNITALSIDLAKNVFQLHGTDKNGKAVLKKKLSRRKLLEFAVNLPPCAIYMEACSSSNYWGREFTKLGHKVKLINPKYVKPYVKRNKNDKNDAAGIAAAARDPDMRFCEVGTTEQQDIQSLHRMRQLVMTQRTALVNQLRGILSEYGIIIPKGIGKIRKRIPEILENNAKNLSGLLLGCIEDLYQLLQNLDKKIAGYDKKISIIFKGNETCQRIETIPGIGELGATILASTLGTGGSFKNGRHFAAFLGLVPKQYSSGGKECLLGISKGGDTYIRTLLIHGARAVTRWAHKNPDNLKLWVKRLELRKGKNKAAVALANKIARIAWAVVHENTRYKPNYKAKIYIVAKKPTPERALVRFGANESALARPRCS